MAVTTRVALRSTLPLLALAIACAPAPAQHAAPLGYYRQPAIHSDTIVFVSEGDLWKVPAAGGVASRLTSNVGGEGTPRISPDGALVAFTAAYEGPTEVYVMPLAGGRPTRLTFDSERAAVVGWDAPEKGAQRVLATTNRFSTLPATQLTAIDPATARRDVIPLAQASDGSFDDKRRLYFTRLAFQGSQTKRYQGGTAQNIWRWDGAGKEAVPLTADYAGTSATPMWWNNRVYFISDRSGMMEVWSFNHDGKDLKRHTFHDKGATVGLDVKGPSLEGGRIVYQLGADLWLYDIARDRDSRLDIRLDTDFDQTRENWVAKPMDYLSAVRPSPDGDRVVLTARGQVFVAPRGQGRLAEVTRKNGVRYRAASFMPDGESLIALSDESGEVEFWKLPANGLGAPEQITRTGSVLRWEGRPSPDGKWLVHYDKNQLLWLLNLETGEDKQIDENKWDDFSNVEWSPDSRWFTYVTHVSNLNRVVRLYNVETGSRTPVTTDRFDTFASAWSVDGRWLYILSDRNLRSVVASPWGHMAPEPFFDKKTKVYQVALKKGVRSPFRPADELQPAKPEKKDEPAKVPAEPSEEPSKEAQATQPVPEPQEKPEPKPAGRKKPVRIVMPVKVDLDGLAARLIELPISPGRYSRLSATEKRIYVLEDDGEGPGNLVWFDISNKDVEPKTLAKDVTSFEVTQDGKSILIRRRDALHMVDVNANANVALDDKTAVKLSGWTFPISPREEWRQMFREAWRLERDYFYDTGMHGLDWQAMLDRYMPLVDRVSSRDELSDLIAQMVGELSTLHIFVRGGDVRGPASQITTAALGALTVRDEAAGGYRVERIFRADPDMPEERSPLLAPGVDMEEGDVILEVNGRPALEAVDLSMLLRNQAGKQVLLKVRPRNPAPKAAAEPDDAPEPVEQAEDEGARLVIVVPISPAAEQDLRYHDWQHSRRVMVEDQGGGELGYLHLRAMGRDNIAEFARGYYPVFNRKGLIIDVRNNRGGSIDSWILSRLLRKAWFYWQPRVGEPYWNMQYAFRGHIVVLCNEATASDGEAFAEGIKRLNIGKVIGTRTWGGEVWLSSSNFLVDGGIATAAEVGVFGPEGQWLIEGHGVDPDIVVDNLPHETFHGRDAQLEAAIKYLQEKIAAEPVEAPKAPPHPNKAWSPSPEPMR